MSLTVFQSNKFKKGCTTQQLPTWKRCVCQEALWQKTQNATHPVPATHPSQPFSGQFSTPRQLPSGKDILCFYKMLNFNSEGFPSMGQDPQPPETARDLPCAGPRPAVMGELRESLSRHPRVKDGTTMFWERPKPQL